MKAPPTVARAPCRVPSARRGYAGRGAVRFPARSCGPWRALERFADGRRAAPVLVVLPRSLVYAAGLGRAAARARARSRSLSRHLRAALRRARRLPVRARRRTPGTPLVVGRAARRRGGRRRGRRSGPLRALDPRLVRGCRRFGPAAAIATAAALLLYPGYVVLFHQLSSDAVFAAAFALVAWLLARAVERPSVARAVALGAGVAGLVFVRPVAQVLLLLVLVPLLAGTTWRAAPAGLGRVRAGCGRPAARLGGAQRRPRRRLHAGAWGRRDASALPRVRRRSTSCEPENGPATASSSARSPETCCPSSPTVPTRSTSSSSSRRGARACTRT